MVRLGTPSLVWFFHSLRMASLALILVMIQRWFLAKSSTVCFVSLCLKNVRKTPFQVFFVILPFPVVSFQSHRRRLSVFAETLGWLSEVVSETAYLRHTRITCSSQHCLQETRCLLLHLVLTMIDFIVIARIAGLLTWRGHTLKMILAKALVKSKVCLLSLCTFALDYQYSFWPNSRTIQFLALEVLQHFAFWPDFSSVSQT